VFDTAPREVDRMSEGNGAGEDEDEDEDEEDEEATGGGRGDWSYRLVARSARLTACAPMRSVSCPAAGSSAAFEFAPAFEWSNCIGVGDDGPTAIIPVDMGD
jgi:hypothetical protein